MRRARARRVNCEKIKYYLLSLVAIITFFLSGSTLWAAQILVPSQQPTIQAAVDVVSFGDTVLVAAGTYTGTGFRDVVILDRTLAILSETGAANTILDLQGSPGDPHRAFNILAAETDQIIIDGFTVTGGYAPSNSGIVYTESAGGVISGFFAATIVRNCVFENNACVMRGGAIYYAGGTLQISDCIMRNNSSQNDAGAVYCNDELAAMISYCTFDNNLASRGGAIYSIGSSPVFDHCLFLHNQAVNQGGAGVCCNSASPDHSNYTNCTFYANQAGSLGGALYNMNGYLTLDNCIIAFCLSGSAVGCYGSNPGYPALTCCNIYDNAGGDYADCIASGENQNGNISRDPLFCDPENGDFSLSIFSPCHPDSTGCGLMGAYEADCGQGQYPLATSIIYGSAGLSGIVTEPNPEISWTYYDPEPSTQAQYEIEVGTDEDWSSAEMWATGQVSSSNQSTVYAGGTLLDHQQYYLRIRVSDGTTWGDWQFSGFLAHLGNIINVPGDVATIQAGIDIAVEGDTVLVAAGTYSGEGNRDIELRGKKIVLKSEDGPDYTIIDAQGTDEERHRVFYIHSDEDSATIIEGFTMTGGFAGPDNTVYHHSGGGGMYLYYASPTIRDCKIIENKSAVSMDDPIYNTGAGVKCDHSNSLFINCEISRNLGMYGSGIFCGNECNPKLIDCTVNGNLSQGIRGGNATLEDCDFLGNSDWGADCYGVTAASCRFIGNGAGIAASYGGSSITECLIEGNGTYGFLCDGSPGSIPNSEISHSSFINNGGHGISGSFMSMSVESCVIAHNAAAGVHVGYSNTVALTNCTIADKAYNTGGSGYYSAIELTFSGMTITTSIIAFNQGGPAASCSGSELTLFCCNVFGNTGGDWEGCLYNQQGINNNFSANPLFCDHINADYGLLTGSPCLLENSPCGAQIGALGAGCSTNFPIAADINYGPEAENNIVTSPTPEIFWTYYDTIATSQISYQVQVGNDDDWETAEMWDSGPVSSGSQSAVYAGADLADHETYYLRIRVANNLQWGDWKESSFYARLSAVIHVPSEWPTIQAAVAHAAQHDTIIVAPGIYSGDGNRDIDFGGKGLAVISSDGPDNTIIDCQGSAEDFHCGFYLHSNEDSVTTVDGFTIRNGYGDAGGAIFCNGANLSVKNCLLMNNTAELGPALALLDGAFTISNCTIIRNTLVGSAGWNSAVYFDLIAYPLIESSIIAFNSASAVSYGFINALELNCCDIYGNELGDWDGYISDQLGININFADDPLFCDLEGGDFHLTEESPCIMSKKACAPVLGALDVGCESTYICGDTNHDGSVNVSDAVRIINFVFIGGAAPDPLISGETNCDGSVNVSDAVKIINYVFIGGFRPCDTNGDSIPDC